MRAWILLAAAALAGCPVADSGDASVLLLRAARIEIASEGATPIGLGGTVKLTCRALDSEGKPLADVSCRWTSGDAAVALLAASAQAPAAQAVDGPSAIVQAEGIGATQLTAELPTAAKTLTASVGVLVTDNVARVQLGGIGTMTLGESRFVGVSAFDAASERLISRVELSSDDTDVVQIAGSVELRAVGIGAAQVRGRVVGSEKQSAPVTVRVKPAGVTVLPTDALVRVGETTELVVEIPGAPRKIESVVSWSATPSGRVTLTPSGLRATVQGVAAGTATVRAVLEGVTGEAAVRVSTPPAFPGGATCSARFDDPTHSTLVFRAAADAFTPRALIAHEVHGGTDVAVLLASVQGSGDALTAALELSAPHPRWTFAVRAVDGDGETSGLLGCVLAGAANPDPARTVVFGADIGVYSVDRVTTDVALHAYAALPALVSSLERAGPRPGPGGALVGIGIAADGTQRIWRRVESGPLQFVGAAIATGSCAPGARPIAAFGVQAGGAEQVVYTVTDGALACGEASLRMRRLDGTSDVALASPVTAAAPWGASHVALARGGLLFTLDLDARSEEQVSAGAAQGLLFADASTAWVIDPADGSLFTFDLVGARPVTRQTVGTIGALIGARGGYALGSGRLAVEDAAGALRVVEGAAAPVLLQPASLGAVRLLLGAGKD